MNAYLLWLTPFIYAPLSLLLRLFTGNVLYMALDGMLP